MSRRLACLLAAVALTATGCADPKGSSRTARPAPSGTSAAPGPGASSGASPSGRQVELLVGDLSLVATVDASAAGDDLLARLPLTLTLRHHGGVELAGRLPARLSTSGAPAGADPDPGDLGYYAPWGDLVLYYGDQSYHDGIVRLGRIDGDVSRLAGLEGDVTVRVARVDPG